MVTHEQRGVVWDLRRNGVVIVTLMRRVGKNGIEYYDWLSKLVYGSNLDEICVRLTEEMNKHEHARNDQGQPEQTAPAQRRNLLSLQPGGW